MALFPMRNEPLNAPLQCLSNGPCLPPWRDLLFPPEFNFLSIFYFIFKGATGAILSLLMGSPITNEARNQ
ncbi:hypothetical protein I7I53_08407 [Histoplasma capsulatum var. duboisii H88]|uniref:Uncharacterized protein n=1 Tax=Ajellomyces capsulatus (strain H88) TaxID=544711 RepID=A0A8A1LID5_AJEC8|nr:hypothetical protein I7I53_08407 [Histoplasma capsulatum var. duboisii H88]